MFLDLKSSTTVAEKLGHFKYSQFIQECFIDLNSIIEKHDAEIYQYVGDEAILIWQYEKGMNKNNCIEVFFSFQKALQNKDLIYKEKYGFIPEFKAGIHGGELMAAEVGIIKKEIAYHGDVINSTARIQSMCNQYQQELIISGMLFEELNLNNDYIIENLGKLPLIGKSEKLTLIGIKKKSLV